MAVWSDGIEITPSTRLTYRSIPDRDAFANWRHDVIGPGTRSIAWNAAYLSTARLTTSAARAIYAIALANWLGVELYGQFNFGLSWYLLLLPLSLLGLDTVLLREVGREPQGANLLVSQTLSLRIVASCGVAILSITLSFFLEANSPSRDLLLVFSCALFGRGLAVWANTIFTSYGKSQFVLALESAFRLLEVLMGTILLFFGYGLIAIALLHAATWFMQGMFGLILVHRRLVEIRIDWERGVFFRLLKLGGPFVVSGLLMAWLLQGPILMYRYTEGVGENLGQLALALQALFIIGGVVSSVGIAALPVLSRSVDRGDSKSHYYIDSTMRAGMLIGGICAISGVALADPLVDMLFGEEYTSTAELLPWTLILIAPYFWIHALSSVVVAHGRYLRIVLHNAIGALVFTSSYILLEPFLNMLGVILALAIGLISSVVGQAFILRNEYPFKLYLGALRAAFAVGVALLLTSAIVSYGSSVSWLAGLGSLAGLSLLTRAVTYREMSLFVKGSSSFQVDLSMEPAGLAIM